MSDTNISVVLHAKDDLRLEERPIPEPATGDVQISIHSVGICGSDVSFWKKGAVADYILDTPMVLGHESSGTVTKLGGGVTHLKVGDRVAVEPGIPCRVCDYCKEGRYNLCPHVKFLATPPVHGNLCRFNVHAADLCYKLPDHVTFEEGALLEPLSVGVHACRRAGVTLGNKVLVCGAGPIGLVCLLVAKSMGAAVVAITDISASRLEFAKSLGADHIVLVDSKDSQTVATNVEAAMGCCADVTIECSGAETSIQTGIYATKSGGMLVLVGLGPDKIMLPIVNAAVREVDIRGSLRSANVYPTALAMVASGQVNVKPLVTHHFPLTSSLDAFNIALTGEGGAVKVVIDCLK